MYYQKGRIHSIVSNTHTFDVINSQKTIFQVQLSGEWLHLEPILSEGDDVNLISLEPSNFMPFCNTGTNYIIVHPEILVSPSQIAQARPCLRSFILQNRHGEQTFTTEAMLLGTVIHELVQTLVSSEVGDVEGDDLEKFLQPILLNHQAEITIMSIEQPDIEKILRLEVRKQWAFVLEWQKSFKHSYLLGTVEETVLGPLWGLKGIIDLTSAMRSDNGVTIFEIKTGRTQSIDHIMQVLLYCILYRTKYATSSLDAVHAQLVYTRLNKAETITQNFHQYSFQALLQSIFTLRNFIAIYFMKTHEIPAACEKQDCSVCTSTSPIVMDQYCNKWYQALEIEEKAMQEEENKKPPLSKFAVRCKINSIDATNRIVRLEAQSKPALKEILDSQQRCFLSFNDVYALWSGNLSSAGTAGNCWQQRTPCHD